MCYAVAISTCSMKVFVWICANKEVEIVVKEKFGLNGSIEVWFKWEYWLLVWICADKEVAVVLKEKSSLDGSIEA